LLAGPLGLVAIAAGSLGIAQGSRPLGLDAASAAALALLAAAALSPLAVRALASALEELDLAEALHWGSMQGVRALTELAAGRRGAGEGLAALLDLGCDRFGLDVGMLALVEGDRWEVHALRAPEGFAAVGTRLGLAETLCRHTLRGDRPLAVDRISRVEW